MEEKRKIEYGRREDDRILIHDCIQAETIKEIYSDVKVLANRSDTQSTVLEKIDMKVDKLMWFFMGLATSACGAVIVMYVKGGIL